MRPRKCDVGDDARGDGSFQYKAAGYLPYTVMCRTLDRVSLLKRLKGARVAAGRQP